MPNVMVIFNFFMIKLPKESDRVSQLALLANGSGKPCIDPMLEVACVLICAIGGNCNNLLPVETTGINTYQHLELICVAIKEISFGVLFLAGINF
jgi:hypothetical protein